MTQVKLRTMGGKGMTKAAWIYAMQKEVAFENLIKRKREREAAAKKPVTLPKLKWMERSGEAGR